MPLKPGPKEKNGGSDRGGLTGSLQKRRKKKKVGGRDRAILCQCGKQKDGEGNRVQDAASLRRKKLEGTREGRKERETYCLGLPVEKIEEMLWSRTGDSRPSNVGQLPHPRGLGKKGQKNRKKGGGGKNRT